MSSRRTFIAQSSKLLAASGLAGLASTPVVAATKKMPAADSLTVALIGCRNMGFGDLENALKQPGVTCAALCDVDDTVLQKRSADVERLQGKKPALYKDYRTL
ncbi:MAG TPA: hypothetical protein VM010_06640, partial [Chitinophagaceae bacterium]|nr:hypothetical protein [Chitinophagaceae bacterium]